MQRRNRRDSRRPWSGKPGSPRHRTLHLVDVDNLVGDPVTTDPERIGRTLTTYRALARFQPGDHVGLACSRHPEHAVAVSLAWPGVQHFWRGRPDGADLALLEMAGTAVEIGGYDRAVIGSGDRIFLVALEILEGHGIPVEVIARPGALAAALRTRARQVWLLRPVEGAA